MKVGFVAYMCVRSLTAGEMRDGRPMVRDPSLLQIVIEGRVNLLQVQFKQIETVRGSTQGNVVFKSFLASSLIGFS